MDYSLQMTEPGAGAHPGEPVPRPEDLRRDERLGPVWRHPDKRSLTASMGFCPARLRVVGAALDRNLRASGAAPLWPRRRWLGCLQTANAISQAGLTWFAATPQCGV